METKACREKSADVKWPIAPDGYIPNSVIRGWIRMLKEAKWDTELDGDENEVDEEFKDYKWPRSRKHDKKVEKSSYVEWDCRPELDERLDSHKNNRDEDNGEGQKKEHKRDKNKDPSRLPDVKGKKEGRGFDTTFERKHLEISKDKESVHAGLKDKKVDRKVETSAEAKMVETNKYHKVQQSDDSKQESVAKMPHTSIEDVQKKAADQVTHKLQSQLPASDGKADMKTVLKDPLKRTRQPENINYVLQNANVNKILQTTNTVKAQGTEVNPVESRQPSAGTTDSLISTETPVQKSGPVVPQMREAEGVEDVEVSETKEQPTDKLGNVEYTESRSHLSSLIKSPKADEKPETIVSEPKTQAFTATRNSNDIHVDQKVLVLYKKFKTCKWVSQKAPGRWSSTDISRSLSKKSKSSSSELEGPGTTKSTHQHGSGEERDEGGATRPIGQTGLWKLIMEGVTESMDYDVLQRLIKDRPTDLQTSGLDMGRLTRIRDESATASQGSAKTTMDNATLWDQVRDRPTDALNKTGIAVVSPSIINGEITTKSIDQEALWGQIRDRPTQSIQSRTDGLDMERSSGLVDETMGRAAAETMDYATSHSLNKDVRPSRLVQSGICEFDRKMGHTDTFRETAPQYTHRTRPGTTDLADTSKDSQSQRAGLDSMVQTGPQSWGARAGSVGRGVGGPARSIPQTEASAQTSPHDSTVFQGLQSIAQVSSERSTEFMAYPGYGGHDAQRLGEPPTILSKTHLRRSESMIQTSSSGVSTDRPTEFWTQTGPQTEQRALESTCQTGTSRDAFPQFDIQTSPGEKNLISTAFGPHDAPLLDSMMQTGGPLEISPGDKYGTSTSRDLLGLQTAQSMAHTPGLLRTSDPEQFLHALSQQTHTNRGNHKPMPKWRQKLYQLIFLCGFCSPQTAKLLAKEQSDKPTTKTEKQHEGRCKPLKTVSSAVHERVVRRVQFRDILDQATSSDNFNCMIPLPALNNFITWDKFGETEYGKLLFEWERGDEEE